MAARYRLVRSNDSRIEAPAVSFQINRREFLLGLAGLGAAITLPMHATDSQVDVEWTRMLDDPWHFEVDAAGTIMEQGGHVPRVNADVYDIPLHQINQAGDLIREVDRCDELRDYFDTLYEAWVDDVANEIDERIDDLQAQLEDESLDPARIQELERQLEAARTEINSVTDVSRDWKHWVRSKGEHGLQLFKQSIDAWLQRPVNWRRMEQWDEQWSGQGRALAFFQHMDSCLVTAIGVAIVEGEHPGSTYFAAELRKTVVDANRAAADLRLPFRFRASKA